MEMIRLSSLEQYYALPMNKWNIKQPPDNEQLESVFNRGKLDLVITPGLGFTSTGLRLGRGKGYYDTFFHKCKKELKYFPYTMGLAFKEQIVQEIPTEPHDFTLNVIITPE
ncbi:hypothetical protein RUM44_000444 [Polyplax serrata]|uniref:5-formyltetrahydrofolate cyclo-ligase n=1 Tax=Polyplax serrata TaxID=468196 RepID=A0ABR1B5G4_POLSC